MEDRKLRKERETVGYPKNGRLQKDRRPETMARQLPLISPHDGSLDSSKIKFVIPCSLPLTVAFFSSNIYK